MVGKLQHLNGQRTTFEAGDLTRNDLAEQATEHSWVFLRDGDEIVNATRFDESTLDGRSNILRDSIGAAFCPPTGFFAPRHLIQSIFDQPHCPIAIPQSVCNMRLTFSRSRLRIVCTVRSEIPNSFALSG